MMTETWNRQFSTSYYLTIHYIFNLIDHGVNEAPHSNMTILQKDYMFLLMVFSMIYKNSLMLINQWYLSDDCVKSQWLLFSPVDREHSNQKPISNEFKHLQLQTWWIILVE